MTIRIVSPQTDLERKVYTRARVPVVGDFVAVNWENEDEERDVTTAYEISGQVSRVEWVYARRDIDHECVVTVG
tara:strand:- start:289 stop:510 length:222 start_codon:yes stop_codon:yes gene_type:complete